MLSRVAESIFWMSRYVERAENVARFIQVNRNLVLDYLEMDQNHWQPLVAVSGDDEDFEKRYGVADEEKVLRFLTFDKENPNSILSCVSNARENARTIRDTISSEMWEHLNHVYLMVKTQSQKRSLGDMQAFYNDIQMASHLFIGLSDTTMSHGQGWHFARMSRLLERADKTARILDVKYFLLLPQVEDVNTPLDSIVWGALLKSASAFEMYRKRFNRIHARGVSDFLIFDREFPRSITYCVNVAQASLRVIVDQMEHTPSAVKELAILTKMVSDTNVEEVLSKGLHEFVDLFQFNLNIVGKEVHDSFFALKTFSKAQPVKVPTQGQSQSQG